MWRADLGFAVGTANTVIYRRGRGIILQEASALALDDRANFPAQAGNLAEKMEGKEPQGVEVLHPIQVGGVVDQGQASLMLRLFLERISGHGFFRPRVLLGARGSVSNLLRRSLLKTVVQAGAREVRWVEEPVAACLGGGIPVHEARGTLLLNMGAGATEIAVLSLGGVVLAESLPLGGAGMDEELSQYLRREKGIQVGKPTAERLRIGLGAAVVPPLGARTAAGWEVVGKDVVNGMPRSVAVSATDVHQALRGVLAKIVAGCRQVLSRCSPELVRDMVEGRAYLTGGAAQLPGMVDYVQRELNLPAALLEEPLTTVATGLGKIIEGKVPRGKVLILH